MKKEKVGLVVVLKRVVKDNLKKEYFSSPLSFHNLLRDEFKFFLLGKNINQKQDSSR